MRFPPSSRHRQNSMNPSHFAHARYGFRLIDRFLYWGDHHFPKSGKIKGSCQPPLNPTIKVTAEISNAKTTFLDKVVHKGNWFHYHSILDIKTHFKPTETFCQYTHFSSIHPPGVKNWGRSHKTPTNKLLEKQHLRKILKSLNHDSLLEATQIIWLKKNYQMSYL